MGNDTKTNGSPFRMIATTDLREAPYNPRKTFDDEALQGLIESVRDKGVLVPLLVRRRLSGNFEIIGGARRFRAAVKAELREVPCRVLDVADDEVALEIAIIDNLQRTDVSELEEAEGFQAWLDRGGHKPEELAAKIKKSPRHVYARLALRKLPDALKAAVASKEIPVSHAAIIATLKTPEDQARALEAAFVQSHRTEIEGAVVQPEEPEEHESPGGYVSTARRGVVSARELEKIVTALKVGEDLAATVESLKAQGEKAALVGNESHGYQSKAVVRRQDWKSLGRKVCKNAAKGVLVDGPDRGKVVDICKTPTCATHFKQEERAPRGDSSAAERQKWQAQREADEAKVAREIEYRGELYERICAESDTLGKDEPLAPWVVALAMHIVTGQQGKPDGFLDVTNADFTHEIIEQLGREADNGWGDARMLHFAAAQLGIDAKAVRADCKRSQKAEANDGLIAWGKIEDGGGVTGRGKSGKTYIVTCDTSNGAKHGRYGLTVRTKGGALDGGMSPFKTVEEAKAQAEDDEKRFPTAPGEGKPRKAKRTKDPMREAQRSGRAIEEVIDEGDEAPD
jgi:ParB family transcriptional regulator, chromosome partitioning protein